MIIEVVVEHLAGSIVGAVWRRPELQPMRDLVEKQLANNTFKAHTRRALESLQKKAGLLIPQFFDSEFINRRDVQTILSSYIVDGEIADIDRLLNVYAQYDRSAKLSPDVRNTIRKYFVELRDTFAADPEYGPVLAARDQRSMQIALTNLASTMNQLSTQVERLSEQLGRIEGSKEIQQLRKRTSGLGNLYSEEIIPFFAQLVLQGKLDLQKCAVDALGQGHSLLQGIPWQAAPAQVLERMFNAMGSEEAYPGRSAVVAFLMRSRRDLADEAYNQLSVWLELLQESLEGQYRAQYSDDSLVLLHHDTTLAATVAKELREAGLKIWLDSEALRPGLSANQQRFDAIERSQAVIALISPTALKQADFRRQLSSAYLLNKILLPVFIKTSDLFQYEETAPLRELSPVAVKANQSYGAAIVEALQEASYRVNPYKGLLSFEEADTSYYFGRETQTEHLFKLIQSSVGARFAAVIGSSGSGKSSLVRAGLIPRLRKEAWAVAISRPAARPLHAFAEAIAELAGISELDLISQIENEQETFVQTAAEVSGMIFFDQFEELFTQEDARVETIQRFIDTLTAILLHEGNQLAIVITLRSDYFPSVEAFPELARLIGSQSVIMSPMQRDDLRRCIREPARMVGLLIEDALVDRILSDVEGKEGALPLMQFALYQLFLKRERNRLSMSAYEKIGGLDQALARHAEQIYSKLTGMQQNFLRRLILNLAQLNELGAVVRQRLSRDKLSFNANEQDEVELLIQKLSDQDSRLLTLSRDENGNSLIEASHEALFTGWPRCKDWLLKNQQDIQTRDIFEQEAEAWQSQQMSQSYLVRTQERVIEAKLWLERGAEFISPPVRKYINATLARDARGRWISRGIVLGSLFLAAVAIVAALIAFRQSAAESEARIIAENQSRLSESGRLSLLASFESSAGNNDTALLLASEAIQIADTPISRNSLLGTLQSLQGLERYVQGQGQEVRAVTFSNDGNLGVHAGEDGTIYLWDAETGEARLSLSGQHHSTIIYLAFTTQTNRLVSLDESGQIVSWDTDTGLVLAEPIDLDRNLQAAALAPDGQTLAVAFSEGGIEIINLAEQQTAYTLDSVRTFALAYSPDGAYLASGGEDNKIILRDAQSNYAIVHSFTGHSNWVMALVFPPTSNLLVSGSADETLRLWKIDEQIALGNPIQNSSGWVTTLASSTDGRYISSGSLEGVVSVWNLTANALLPEMEARYHNSRVNSIAFRAGTADLLSGSTDGRVAQWNQSLSLGRYWQAHTGNITQVRWNAAGDRIVTSAEDGQVIVWDAATLQAINSSLYADGIITSLGINSQYLVYSDLLAQSGSLYLVDALSLEPVSSIALESAARSLAISADSSLLLTGSLDGSITLFNPGNFAQVVQTFTAHDSTVLSLALHPNQQQFASGDESGYVHIWSVDTASPLDSFEFAGERITTLNFTPNGDFLLIGTSSGRLAFFNLQTTTLITGEISFESHISEIAVDPNSTYAMLVQPFEGLRLVSLETQQTIGQQMRLLDSEYVWSGAFSPDGQKIVVGGVGSLGLIEVAPEAWIHNACRMANRTLSAEEILRFGLQLPERVCRP